MHAKQDLFETLETGIAFHNQVSAGPTPDLFQLARLLDQQETAVVAVVDSNTTRLFVMRTGFFEEVEGPDDASVHYRKRSTGGLNEARYQRHIEKHRSDFAAEAAVHIERLIEEEGAKRLILAGDEVAIPLLEGSLSAQIAEKVEYVLRVHIRAPRDEVREEIEPVLAQAEAAESHSIADQLIDAIRSDSLGVAGLERTRRALEHGQVDVLLLAQSAEMDEETRNEVIRQAMNSGAGVEIVENHTTFQELGGVGALLRYRID